MKRQVAAISLIGVMLMAPNAARAEDDACTVVLCLAGNWRNIGACIPPVRRVLRRLMFGGIPFCSMSGGPGNGAFYSNADATNCPPQYVYWLPTPHSECGRKMCRYRGVIDVHVDGKHFNRVWWDQGGDTVTQWLPDGRATAPDQIDTQFEDDFAAWQTNGGDGICQAQQP